MIPVITRRNLLIGASALPIVSLVSESTFAMTVDQAKRYLRERETALRVAERRYAQGTIPYANVRARQREVEEARAALARAQGRPSSGQSSASSDSSDSGGGGSQVTVRNSSEFSAALRNASAGQRIVLDNGTYSGTFTIDASGRSGAPIIIAAANALSPAVQSALTIRGNYVEVRGLSFRNATVRVSGNNCVVSRNDFSGGSGRITAAAAGNLEISYNEFTGWSGRCVDINPRSNGITATGYHVHRNYFHRPGGGTVGIALGQQTGHTNVNMNSIVEYNLFSDCGMEQVINVKSSGNTIRYNTMTNSGWFMNRHGSENRFIGNWIEGSRGGIWLSDQGGEALDNRLIGNCSMWVLGGDITPSQVRSQHGGYPRAENTRLINNRTDSRTRIGVVMSSWSPRMPAIGTRVEGHHGRINLETQQSTAVIGSTSSAGAGQGARQLGRSAVGPQA